QATLRELTALRDQAATWQRLLARAREAEELRDLARAETDDAVEQEATREIEAISAEVDRLEFELQLSGEHDRSSALVSLHAGSGGIDAQDWADMLMRMYVRWAERRGFKTEMLDYTEGEEAGIKGATVAIRGPYAYGYLRGERGVH